MRLRNSQSLLLPTVTLTRWSVSKLSSEGHHLPGHLPGQPLLVPGQQGQCPGVQRWFSKSDRRHNDTTIGDYCSLGAKPTNKKHMKRRKYKEASNDLLLWWDARWLYPWYCQLMEIVSQWFACNQQNTLRRFLWIKTRFIPGMRGQMIASWGRKLGAIFAKYPYWLLL